MSKHEKDTEEKTDKIKVSIKEIKKKLSKLGIMHPGSINTQYNVCGNPNCACKNKENPKKHGPYYQLSYSNKGKSTTKFIKEEEIKTTRKQIENYKIFKEMNAELVNLNVELVKALRMNQKKQIS